jgi:hypothetical protein
MNLIVADMHSNTKKKRRGGRSLSRMDDILLKEPGTIAKIKIELNSIGQPVGENYRKLSSVIGILSRKMLPVGCSDWRLVDAKKKMALWDEIKVLSIYCYDICVVFVPLLFMSSSILIELFSCLSRNDLI